MDLPFKDTILNILSRRVDKKKAHWKFGIGSNVDGVAVGAGPCACPNDGNHRGIAPAKIW